MEQTGTKAYAVFHLNLAFSALATEQRATVIERCYTPLLELVESHHIPIGIEMSSWTLAQIQQTNAAWVDRFRALLAQGACELIGSGLIQMIGPLAPVAVNRANLALGCEDYQRLLGRRPRLALVNEMAYSAGLVDLYHEAGFEALIVDRDNAQLVHRGQLPEHGPWYVQGVGGALLPLLWSDSILFQKLQRWVHRDISSSDYRDYLAGRLAKQPHALPLYCSDAEIFGFRPKRYSYENDAAPPGEWDRLAFLCTDMVAAFGMQWCLPSQALSVAEDVTAAPVYTLQSAAQPVPVKKQPKYNVSRWAITGQSDLHLNTLCYRAAALLAAQAQPDAALLRELCLLWSSDLRTHILRKRLSEGKTRLAILLHQLKGDPVFALQGAFPKVQALGVDQLDRVGVIRALDPEHFLLTLRTPHMLLTLNLRRGLSIDRLAFAEHDFQPLIGTLPHGYFSCITLGADFFSGHIVIEPRGGRRITDLNTARPQFFVEETAHGRFLIVQVGAKTELGPIIKRYRLDLQASRLELAFLFPEWPIPDGTMRLGHFTLLPEAFQGPLWVETHQGGFAPERFALDEGFDHSQNLSSIISCSGGFGATTGSIAIGDAHKGLEVQWDPGQAALFPMMRHTPQPPGHLTRIIFSLAEWDETRKPGGVLPNVGFTLMPKKCDR